MDNAMSVGQSPLDQKRESAERLWHTRRGIGAAFFIAFLVLIFGLALHKTAYDVYLDASLGKVIATEGIGGLPHIAIVSRPGALRLSWLWQALAYGFVRLFGITGVCVISALLVTAGTGAILAALAKRLNVVLAGFILLIAAYAGRQYLMPNGQSAGIFLFGAMAALLLTTFESEGRRFWWAAPLMVLWVNLDFSWPAGVLLCAAFVPAVWLTNVPRKREKAIAILVAIFVTILNPDGIGAYQVFWQLPLAPSTPEAWISPAAATATHKGAVYAMAVAAVIVGLASRAPAGLALATAAVVVTGLGVSRQTLPIALLASAAAIATGLLSAAEMVMVSAKGKAPAVFKQWVAPMAGPGREEYAPEPKESGTQAVEDETAVRHAIAIFGIGTLIAGAGLVAVLALFAWTAVGSSVYSFGPGVDESTMPEKAVAFVKQSGLQGVFYAHPKWAGYTLWTLYPQARLAYDPRPLATTPFSAKLASSVVEVQQSAPDEEIVRAYAGARMAFAMVPYFKEWPRAKSITRFWAPVYWDDSATVFVPNTVENIAFVQAHEQRLTYPGLFGVGLTKENLPAVEAQLERKTQEDPNSAIAQYELGMSYYVGGQFDKAAMHLIVALGNDPGLANAWHSLGDIVRMSKSADITQVLLNALAADPLTKRQADAILQIQGPEQQRQLELLLYSEAVVSDRDFAMAYLRLGNAYLEGRDVGRGLSALMEAQKADDRHPQLDASMPGLRKQLDAQVEMIRAALSRPRQPGIGSTGVESTGAAIESSGTAAESSAAMVESTGA